jgi:hypothetical protein
MNDQRTQRPAGDVRPADGPQKGSPREKHASSTEGTDRDFDESGESANQGHSHLREQRGDDS